MPGLFRNGQTKLELAAGQAGFQPVQGCLFVYGHQMFLPALVFPCGMDELGHCQPRSTFFLVRIFRTRPGIFSCLSFAISSFPARQSRASQPFCPCGQQAAQQFRPHEWQIDGQDQTGAACLAQEADQTAKRTLACPQVRQATASGWQLPACQVACLATGDPDFFDQASQQGQVSGQQGLAGKDQTSLVLAQAPALASGQDSGDNCRGNGLAVSFSVFPVHFPGIGSGLASRLLSCPGLAQKQPEADDQQGQAKQLAHGQPAKGQVAKLAVRQADKFDKAPENGVTAGKKS